MKQAFLCTDSPCFHYMQIMYMGWGQERASPGRLWQAWKPKFIALKGTEMYLFDIPPVSTVELQTLMACLPWLFRTHY